MLEGLPPHRPTRLLRLVTDEARARATTELLGEVFDPTETAVAAFETPDGTWLLEAYFAHDPDEDAVLELIRPIVGAAADQAVFEAIEERDWVKASLDGLKPVRAGRILVHGSHDRHVVRANDVPVQIDAALAFGTGHHGTTAGCLLALVEIGKVRRPRRLLDVGTGTGILAIAAASWLKRPVVAGDLDPLAITVAEGNARRNGVAGRVSFYVGPGTRHPRAHGRRFDLVLANILAKPLRRLAPALTRALEPGGTLVLSGLMAPDVQGVLSAYAAQGLCLARRRDRDGWATLVLRRGGAAPRRRRLPAYDRA
ncbi:50S ribosomal protein L11 methyltransferase [Chelatococcus reniformis]|uniref:Ribosomal protein L11 methyltransferase n=1 Tax=Chelatococcus reniformis TaxID=1494448 RepID=A0A916UQZ3_9HYPH|nr:50S ribosomal protein L11 methyltransferase [Chelatococcus reniformis]GGC83990.1 ribosomal protein L11 methyltransferase [Chelatococcus reniformis]